MNGLLEPTSGTTPIEGLDLRNQMHKIHTTNGCMPTTRITERAKERYRFCGGSAATVVRNSGGGCQESGEARRRLNLNMIFLLHFNKPLSKRDEFSSKTEFICKDNSSIAELSLENQMYPWKQNPSWVDLPPEVKVTVPKGSLCNLNLKVNVGLPPEAVYNIVTDPDNKRVFKNIKEVISRKIVLDEGLRQVVEVEQAAIWSKGKGRIASKLVLEQLIQPSIVPPAPISWYLRGITTKTTEMLITDLLTEAARIRQDSSNGASEEKSGDCRKRHLRSNLRIILFPVFIFGIIVIVKLVVKVKKSENPLINVESPALLQVPYPEFRAVRTKSSSKDLPNESCRKSGSCPATILITGENRTLGEGISQIFRTPYILHLEIRILAQCTPKLYIIRKYTVYFASHLAREYAIVGCKMPIASNIP
ncbi:hypothetical protein RD792_008415 [Penstemon davidsonii]|uniref:Uncharacterized protein n=1 Tax=Penstemon davidsonii TaxID=160366 RepID=A0ABR0D921_9LAMI|nr:hypothetical protein RD792_008415 [Penstemon davidsonii]